VIVAVIDGGVDTEHEDIENVLWTNRGELPGNGVDDDENGFTDDINGWNFLGGVTGESVNFDTYEVTRLHGACLGEAAGNGTPRPDDDLCAEVAEAHAAEVVEMTELAEQITQIEQIYPVVVQLLRRALGTEPTIQNVTELAPLDPQLVQARGIYLQLASAGIDETVLAREGESVRGRLEFGLDTGFDPRPIVGDDYEDLAQRAYGNPDVAGPDPSHGTSVASVVAAERNNGIGLDGAGDGIRIMAIRAVPNGDERDKDVANAIRYAVDNGAHIINMSFGKDYSPWRDVVEDAIQYAEERGVLLVHASGNDGRDLSEGYNYPEHRHGDRGTAELWVEVGASGWQGADSLAASFSNYGAAQVHVFAPGVAIYAASPGNDYSPSDGTSVAAPVVSGIAGMLMAYFPELSAAEVRAIILETATDVGANVVARPGAPEETVPFGELSATGGIVNAAAAVERAMR
jgi:subtilisin family serine protease